MTMLEKNLSALRERQPEAAARVERSCTPEGLERAETPQGLPVHRLRGRLLHSQRDPQREARKQIARLDRPPGLVVGFGDGFHIEALLERFPGAEEITVAEPEAGLLRAVFETRDLSRLLSRIRLAVGQAPASLVRDLTPAPADWYVHPPVEQIQRRYLEAARALWAYRSRPPDPLRILVVGPVYGGSYPVACYAKEALSRLGHEVAFADLTSFEQGYHELEGCGGGRDLLVSFEELLSRFIEKKAEAFRPDLAFILAQAPIREESLKRLKEKGIRLAYWFVEDYRRMRYWERIAPLTDVFFTIQREAEGPMRAAGTRCVRYLPLAALEGFHEPLPLTEEERKRYGADLSFVGAGYPNRRNFFARLSRDLRIWGNEWEGAAPALAEMIQDQGRRVSAEESVRIFNASRINLNLHSSTCHDGVDPHGDFVNPRTFEIAGCRAFQLVDRRSLLGELFEPDELALFQDLEDARDKIDHFLSHEQERLAYARRGFERVRQEHTYDLRMREMLGFLYEQGLRSRRRGKSARDWAQEARSPELRQYLERFPADGPLELEDIVGEIRKKNNPGWEDRVFLALMAFKEESTCRGSCS